MKLRTVALSLLFSVVVAGQSNPMLPEMEVSGGECGAMRMDLGFGIVVNRHSTLDRRCYVIRENLPLEFLGTPRLEAVYEQGSRSTRGEFQYRTSAALISLTSERITAFEARFLVFDVFGRWVKTLSATEIADMGGAETFSRTWRWTIYSENEAMQHFASIAFVSKVRTADGKVHRFDSKAVAQAIRELGHEIAEDDLEPTPESGPIKLPNAA